MAVAPALAIRDSEFVGTVGVARADITPPPGIYARCWGSSTHDIASGVHKPLLASCVMFANAEGRGALTLLALDLSWWSSKQDELELRELHGRQPSAGGRQSQAIGAGRPHGRAIRPAPSGAGG